MAEDLFAKKLPVVMRCSDRDERKVHLHFKMEIVHVMDPIQKKELMIRLTNEKDLFFLYTLKLGEEDFQYLKTQQGLLVDFSAFPQKVVDLLNMCLLEEGKDLPKFILQFVGQGGNNSDHCIHVLNIVETNPFKHLIHLSLKFIPGQDSDIKKYLADCLKQLKETNELLHQRLEHTNEDLTQRLQQTQESLTSKCSELETLKSQWSSKINEMKSAHKEELASEKEKALEVKSSCQSKLEHDRKELEQSHLRIVKQMEAKLYDLENTNKELQEKKYKLESNHREMRSRISSQEEELQHLKQEVQALRKQNSAMDADLHEQEKIINQQRTRIAVLEQEVKDKEQVLARSSDLLDSEQDQKRKYEEEIDVKQKEIIKLENKVKVMSVEVKKGNEIIRKLQGDNKNYHAKVKLRSQIAAEQEKILSEKDQVLEKMQNEISSMKENLKQKEEQNQKLCENLENTRKKLEESRELLKTNENVIQWLNKQVNEVQLSGTRTGMNELGHHINGTTAAVNFRNHSAVSVPVPPFIPSSFGQNSRFSHPEGNSVNSHLPLHKAQNNGVKFQVQYNPAISRKPVISQTSPAAGNRHISPIAEVSRPPCLPGGHSEEVSPMSASSGTGSATDMENDSSMDGHSAAKKTEAVSKRGVGTVGNPLTANKNYAIPFLPVPITTSSRLPAHLSSRSTQPPLASVYFPVKSKPS